MENARFFKMPFIVKGNWNLCNVSAFPREKYLGADTETKMYYKDKLLIDDDAYRLYKKNGQQWCKENIEVRAYAFMLSNGEDFALFQCIEDFMTCCAMMLCEKVFWYNARFDFAIFDYYFLTNGWTLLDEQDTQRYQHAPNMTYQSLNGDFGQRYEMTFWKSYLNQNSQEKVHKVKMLDICNIYGGGLKKNLEDWKIVDRQGNDIRKLDMEYAIADITNEDDLQYMINDTKGLYLLAEKIDKIILEISGFSLFKGDYITAGGLAKKSMLKFMFGCDSPRLNVKYFKQAFPITIEQDRQFRDLLLYQGGKCLVNPYKKNKVQSNVYKYDVNSMYPTQMYQMDYPFGKPRKLKKLPKDRKGKVYIVCLKRIFGTLKPNMIPVWCDGWTKEYVSVIDEREPRMMWLEELEEYEYWYDLDYEFDYVLEYQSRSPKGMKTFIETFYNIKSTSKGAIRQGAKLFLNSSYGKLAQKVERTKCEYQLDDCGVVHLVDVGTDVDENGMLSVVVGSRVSALARVMLMTYIREICNDNPKDNFIYCDTDSVHSLTSYDKCDKTKLGAMDCEGVYERAIYLAPKSYLMMGSDGYYEVHCKGVNTSVVEKEILEQKGSFSDAIDVFKPNRYFKCLCSLNVKGGKALIYVDKMIVNDKNFVKYDDIYGELEDEW